MTQSIAAPRRRGSMRGGARMAEAAQRVGDRPALVVGALFVISAALAAYFATKIASFQPDELGYTHMAMALGDRPALWTDAFGGDKRLNQLYPLTLAPLYRLFGNVTAYELTHWWNAILMGSAVVPVYLLARQVIERRSAAYMAAAVAAVVPWLTLSSSQLTEVVAYPACAWALWAMQRSLARPSWRTDLVAIAAIAVATYGRLQLGILGPVFVAAILMHELGWALTGGAAAAGGRAQALRRARKRLLRDHAVVAVVTAIGAATLAVLVAAGALQGAFGYYGNTLGGRLIPPGLWSNAQANFTFLTWGVAVLPMVFTAGLVVENACAPRERRVHAFAVLTILTFLAIVITVARINAIFLSDVVQERYVMFVVPLLIVGLLAGLVETRSPAVTLLLGAAVVVPLAATTSFQLTPSAFWFLVSPGMTSFFEIVAPWLGRTGGALGDAGISRFVLGGCAIAVACLLLAAGLRAGARRRRLVAGAIPAAVIVACATITVYSFHRVIYGSADYRGLGTSSLLFGSKTYQGVGVVDVVDRDWIDRTVGRRTPVTLLATQIGQASDSREQWFSAEFWNRSIQTAFRLSSQQTSWHPARLAKVSRSGRLVGPAGVRYVVLAASGVPLGLVGRQLARSDNGALALLDTGDAPLRAAWALRGLSDDGWLRVQRPATLTIFGRRERSCQDARLEFSVPKSLPESRRVRVTGEGVDRIVVVNPRTARAIRVRACGSGPLRLTLAAMVPPTATAPGATVQVRSVTVVDA